MTHAFPLLLALASLAACSTPFARTAETSTQLHPASSAATSPEELVGVLVPADPAVIAPWPEAYAGELLVLEARPHGATVAEGDVVARLDARAFADQVHDAELALGSARVAHAGLLERNAVAAEAAASGLAQAVAGLDRARRALAGYEQRELAFARRSDGISEQREAAYVDDQKDELAQLEAMYTADELTDATEEIVLKRSRRDLASTLASTALSKETRAYNVELTEALQREARHEEVAVAELALAHLRRTQAVDAAARADAEKRSAAELERQAERLAELERDRALFEVRAPRAGVLLHGSRRSFRSGAAPARVERGGRLDARGEAFLVALPGDLAVALELPESARPRWADGTEVVVRPVGGDGELRGTLAVGAYPTGTNGAESTFEATVRLDGPTAERGALLAGQHVKVERAEPSR
jgi:hypothetical protein